MKSTPRPASGRGRRSPSTRLLHRSVPPKLPFNRTWTTTTPGPKQIPNPQHHEAEERSEHSSKSGLTKYFQPESQEERVQPCRTFGHTSFRSLPRFSCAK